jgi:polyhydroxyalkanoate synthase
VREAGHGDPELARDALAGLRAYQDAPRGIARRARDEVARSIGAALLDCGGSGPPAVLVPSLINPPRILDLDCEVSLADAVAAMGRRTLLLDWGPADERSELDVAGHVEQLLLPLLRGLDRPPALVGYCLGGTMAIAAANLAEVERVATLAAPWSFAGYGEASRNALAAMWGQSREAARALGALPMEVLQAAFWSLDPDRTVRKFAQFARLEPGSPEARRFVALEDWANEGNPLPYPAARELIEDLFGADLPGSGEWRIADRAMTDRLALPLLNLIAAHDRISPREAAPAGDNAQIAAGHVGMVVGSARRELHQLLATFLAPLAAPRPSR